VAVNALERSAERLLDTVLLSLKVSHHLRKTHLSDVQFRLLELEGKLRIVNAVGLMSSDYLAVFLQELDAVVRTLRKFMPNSEESPLIAMRSAPVRESRKRVLAQRSASIEGIGDTGTRTKGESRKDKVMAIIKDKGEATIKDIAELITDCSEKTIQRELQSLINEGMVVREGERRWSKYRLAAA
jgi:hypothetical protein